ncbi:hypothetical protein XA68_16450 [Ophiocordyceps unilateralis]|uniref:ATP-dependent Clp protease proteolytic subunit n=1 Tax=Ophiocordyceps unilateralis TaxID=268505 RepID=A0A2A9PK37_OPHUN|nr:hypothetical protein XA68_16450 [Ophiocordyceps unilateralis]
MPPRFKLPPSAIRGLPQRHVRTFGFDSSMPPRGDIPMPYIEETSSAGRKTWDIFSKLLQERIICLNGTIENTMSASIVAQLLWLESDTPDKPIIMYINSPGGSVSSGMAIYDTMMYIKSPVSTVCVGGAASMASILLAGGEAGKRYALPNSSIMVHQPSGGRQGQVTDLLIYANQIQRVRDQSNKIMQYHLNKAKGYDKYSIEDINDMMERDRYMNADEAVEAGIIDEVLTRRASPKDAETASTGVKTQ